MEAIASFFSLKPLLLNVKEVVMFTEARDCQLNVVLFQGPNGQVLWEQISQHLPQT